ncbi:MAG TPA: glycoside hydrolase family 127 protein [Chryseosolibacter sp.]
MRSLALIVTVVIGVLSANAQRKDYPIQAVPFTNVKVNDNFWGPRLEINRTVTIPSSFEQCRSTGRIKNFEMAAAREGKFCTVYPFDDTDIYKTIEGASYSLKVHPDPTLEAYIDTLITLIKSAQEPDGYLYTARTINPLNVGGMVGAERWVKEREHSHELYNAGHLYEAAYAHYLATGKKSLLNIALDNANLIESVFGPAKRHVAPGHQVIEMGLVKLYRITGEEKYLNLARYFLDERGRVKYDSTSKDVFRNGMYWQDHKPVTKQTEAVGHAVRAVYMYAGMADIAALTGDESYLNAIDKIWENAVGKKLYVTGGIGAAGDGERFGNDYELPNATAYCETCASIGNVYWNHRMFLLHGESKYIDVLEKSLYNSLLSGIGMDGKTFFYTNTLQIKDHFRHNDIETKRSAWFPCSCCPTNVTRILPSVPGYAYAQRGDDIYVNLFISGSAEMKTSAGKALTIKQQSNYPWDGNIKVTVEPARSSRLRLLVRVPGWAQKQALPGDLYHFQGAEIGPPQFTLNGKPVQVKMENGYAVFDREWKKGDVVEMSLPMDAHKVYANEKLTEDAGRVAFQRGPLMYCAEAVDNEGKASNLVLPSSSALKSEFRPDLLGGVVVLTAEAKVPTVSPDGTSISTVSRKLTAIPYYAWAHRGEGEMTVWFPEKLKAVDLIAK